MRGYASAIAIAALLSFATPALADYGSGASLERALFVAHDFSFIGFSEIQYSDGKWEIEGRDVRGKTLEIDVDALTGAVTNVDRFD